MGRKRKGRGSANNADHYVKGRRVKAQLGPFVLSKGKKRRRRAWVYGNTVESTGKGVWKVKWDDRFNLAEGEYSVRKLTKAKIWEGVPKKEIDLATPEDEDKSGRLDKTVVSDETRNKALAMCKRKIAILRSDDPSTWLSTQVPR